MKQSRGQQEAELRVAAEAMIKEYLDWAESRPSPNLSAIEEAVLRLREALGARMASVVIEGQEVRQPVEAAICPHCGERLRYKGQKGNAVESRVGLLHLERGYYHCAACQHGFFPPG